MPSPVKKADAAASNSHQTGAETDRGEQLDGSGAASELSTMIDSLLNDLTSKFTAVANELTAKIDDMSRRIDNLEQSLTAQETEGEKDKDEPSAEGTGV